MAGLKIGILGFGGAGRAHARRFLRNRSVDEVIGFDTKPVRSRRYAVVNDLNTLLSRVDAVSICTPDATHFEYIAQCLERGKHVLVEKPMVASASEAEELRPVLQRNSHLQFAVHHQMRCVPAFRRAKELIADGTLGELFYIEANYWHDMRARSVEYDNWRVQDAGQSVIFGAACHPLDLILDLIGEPLQEHTTFVNKNAFSSYPAPYTSATTMLRFANNVVAKCHTNNCAIYPQLNNLIILGDQGTYIDGVLYHNGRFHDTVRLGEVSDSQNLVRHLKGKLLWSPLARILSVLAARLPMFRSPPFSSYNHELACRALVNNFVDSIVGNAPVLVGFEDGLRVIALCEELEDAALARQPQTRTAAWHDAMTESAASVGMMDVARSAVEYRSLETATAPGGTNPDCQER